MKDLAAKRKRGMTGQRLDTQLSIHKAELDRVGFTIFVKPALRNRLDRADFKLKIDGLSISRPDFWVTIVLSGLDQHDAMLEQSSFDLASVEEFNSMFHESPYCEAHRAYW